MKHLPDLLCATGLALVTTALWMVSVPLALGALGAFLISAGVLLYRKRR